MNTILLFVVPPIAGAIIAYSTNVIAIRMLFRPLREIRVFGKIRLPFTPGILPRQRKKLAQSIGAMVERELVTPEVLRERLAQIEIGELAQTVTQFLRREDIHKELQAKGRLLLRNIIMKLNIFQRFFVTAAQYDQTLQNKMPEIIDELIIGLEKALQEERVKKKLTGAIDSQVENILLSINIKSLVEDRINSLDMERVERIILDVISNQFKWIEIFGGILGFMIGLFQAVFTYLFR